ncbi:MAG TPA: Asp-tRNA(Asn)/Glu-tRNA(Gln) amidotransferase subunit GatA [Candidatus Paceibacterota bacterium]|nr:Asp-tRNA(Asn)/Glu-tRNA(Gln) amidotransferase subunit GatA [Candidatus Paceibacterota bacterium]
MTIDLSKLTVADARRALDAKEYSALDLTNAYLSEIEKRNPELNAYVEVWANSARDEAKKADAMIAAGTSQPLTGIPLAVKDNILIKGRVASSASKILENYRASYDATVIQKLKAQRAVFLGRTNMDEFAMGSSTENSAFGVTKNPIDTSRVPGGSSGGSAAAVAAGLALAALGSDTGGSIRQPASHCGIVGLKTTYGAVSRFGLMPMGSSLDQIGPLAKTIEDARIVFEGIRGHDSNDSTSLSDYTLRGGGKKIGVPREFLKSGVDADVLAVFNATLERLAQSGYDIGDVEMPNLPYALPVYYIVCPAEVSTNLARYDGIRYGLSVPADTIGEVYTKTRGAGFGAEVRRRILIGTFVLSSGYTDAYYRKARGVRDLIRADFARVFKMYDCIALPTAPGPAFKIGEKASDPLAMYAEDIFSVTANLAGVPAISVPSGTVEREGKRLPVGFQLVAPHRGEGVLFQIGADVEKASA